MANTRRLKGALLIGYSFSEDPDVGVLTVGRRNNKGVTEIVNAFQGKEAHDLLLKLITKEERK